MMKRITRNVVAGFSASALIAAGAILGTTTASASDGTLTIDPKEGGERSSFSVVTSAGCANSRATHFIIKMTGAGLREEVNLTGVARIALAGSTPTSTAPMRSISSQTFEMVKIDNGGRLPNGVYTITFQCREQLSTTALRSFSTQVTVTNTGGQVTWKEGGSPTPQVLVNTRLPKVSGKAVVGQRLRASAGTWAPKPDRVTYNWRIGKKSIGKSRDLRIPAQARGKTVVLTVTAIKSGYRNTSVNVRVRVR